MEGLSKKRPSLSEGDLGAARRDAGEECCFTNGAEIGSCADDCEFQRSKCAHVLDERLGYAGRQLDRLTGHRLEIGAGADLQVAKSERKRPRPGLRPGAIPYCVTKSDAKSSYGKNWQKETAPARGMR